MRRAGLRARVVAGFAAGALALSASMALVSYEVTRGALLAGRERATVRSAAFDARVVNASLTGGHTDVVAVLRSLDTGGNRRTLLRLGGEWYARDTDPSATEAVPAALQRMVGGGEQGMQRVELDGVPALVVGVPLSPTAALYEIDYLRELDQTLRTLGWVLTLVAGAVAVAGAGLGWYATRYVLRPLRSVADAAQGITAGDLSARLDPAGEPDLARLTTSFNEMVDQLSARMERDRRFAADVSHELRSPLQTLAAAASVLHRRREHLDGRTATAAGLVVAEIERFQSLVDDLLELARGDQPVRRSPVDVHELARRVLDGQGLAVQLVEPPGDDAPRWHVDRRRVEQILANLLDNAVRHGGGPVAVRVTCVAGTGRIEVDDEGPGVVPGERAIIFDRFVRGRAAGARGGGDGTGLGLALVAQHAAAHGGRVVVLDRPGGGARFRVELAEVVP